MLIIKNRETDRCNSSKFDLFEKGNKCFSLFFLGGYFIGFILFIFQCFHRIGFSSLVRLKTDRQKRDSRCAGYGYYYHLE
jgi:hypothetical protein